MLKLKHKPVYYPCELTALYQIWLKYVYHGIILDSNGSNGVSSNAQIGGLYYL